MTLFGLFLVVAGLALRTWAILMLHRVGVVGDGMELVRRPPDVYTEAGPYRFSRHPAYIGSLLAFAGVGIVGFGAWAGALLALPAWPFYRERIVLENRLRVITAEAERLAILAEEEYQKGNEHDQRQGPGQLVHLPRP